MAFTCLAGKRSGDIYTATDLERLGLLADGCADVLARLDAVARDARGRPVPAPRGPRAPKGAFPLNGTLPSRMRLLATIQAPDVTQAILDGLELPSRAPPTAAAVLDLDDAAEWSGDFGATF